ncbi:MAG: GNAT family N-acetyltransferase [Candidatus Yanofskybacteria bacterium]|nr:GNAT family N-acetyltransferase [Candidatus Yanofskybacteria bacterium]
MIKIEKLKESDVAAYYRLVRRVILNTSYYSRWAKKEESTGYPPKWIRKGLKNRRKLFLCAKDKDKAVGFLFGSINTGMLHLMWLGVDSKYRNKGIAEQLMRKAEQWAKGKIHKIWFDTRTTNRESIPLAKKLKYCKAATLRKHYYGQDFYIWEKLIK